MTSVEMQMEMRSGVNPGESSLHAKPLGTRAVTG